MTGGLGAITFERRGWFLARAITDLEHTFRFASTAPFYVEIGQIAYRLAMDRTGNRVGRAT